MSKPDVKGTKGDPVSIFSALGDDTRLLLVERLSDGQPHSIAQLCDGLDLTRQGVTKHLKILEQSNIVESNRVGRETLFVYSPDQILATRDYLGKISQQWDEALIRLKNFVEEDGQEKI